MGDARIKRKEKKIEVLAIVHWKTGHIGARGRPQSTHSPSEWSASAWFDKTARARAWLIVLAGSVRALEIFYDSRRGSCVKSRSPFEREL